MPKKRLKKISVVVLIALLVLSITAYFFRYKIIFAFEYNRINSLSANVDTANPNSYRDSSLPLVLDKLWVHRVNSLQRYDWLEKKFHGFESDLFFNENSKTFSVYHPPIQPEGDTLSFSRYLSHINLKTKEFWFDTRGVNGGNAESAIAAFEGTGKADAIKRNCIVELYDVTAAEKFSLAGYRVSLDLDAIWINRMKSNSAYRDSINIALRLVPYISQQSTQLSQLKELFPAKKYIIWHLYFADYFNIGKVQDLLDDPRVEVVLLNIKSPYLR